MKCHLHSLIFEEPLCLTCQTNATYHMEKALLRVKKKKATQSRENKDKKSDSYRVVFFLDISFINTNYSKIKINNSTSKRNRAFV